MVAQAFNLGVWKAKASQSEASPFYIEFQVSQGDTLRPDLKRKTLGWWDGSDGCRSLLGSLAAQSGSSKVHGKVGGVPGLTELSSDPLTLALGCTPTIPTHKLKIIRMRVIPAFGKQRYVDL